MHEAFNDISDLSLAADYRMAYGILMERGCHLSTLPAAPPLLRPTAASASMRI
jgi:hypothetical protein